MRFAVIIEKGKRNYSAYSPDVPGCGAVGDTLREVKRLITEALAFHFEGMIQDGDPLPKPTSLCCYAEVDLGEIKRLVRPKSRGSV